MEMPDYEVGDVVNVPFPNQEDPRKSTLRIGIVIENLQDEVEVLFLTKQIHQAARYRDSFVIPKDSPEGLSMGLTYDSLVAPHRAFVLKKIAITPPPRGRCPDSLVLQLEEIIQAA